MVLRLRKPSRRPVVTDPPYFMWMHNRHFEQVIQNLLQLANPIAQARGTIFALNYLCEFNAVPGNPVDGVKRATNEGSTPAHGDAQVRRLLGAPPHDTLKGVRDRAILATLLCHLPSPRRGEGEYTLHSGDGSFMASIGSCSK